LKKLNRSVTSVSEYAFLYGEKELEVNQKNPFFMEKLEKSLKTMQYQNVHSYLCKFKEKRDAKT